jgi:putative oxidoreductase
MTNPMAGTTQLIEGSLGLPFAPQFALFVGLLEGIGGLMLAAGLTTRPLAAAFAIQMVFICFATGPTYPWIDRGIEYPIVLGLIAAAIALRGGGRFAIDAVIRARLPQRVGREHNYDLPSLARTRRWID